ncbi:FKBP-type peptidyl-prolyl cis-trans isomerase [Pontibacter aydingkolensis]|uniref:Colicin import membrane protein n=1 Tax=Pontibacter aydingkolensis TaxID=1911536 RepID=A0ABS7CXY1_9BACT|nr:hypothetical protein [Pontibacter aydingkolensis]MBW7468677.1 hypothetical protein [Pontibacter aydingkolensis]
MKRLFILSVSLLLYLFTTNTSAIAQTAQQQKSNELRAAHDQQRLHRADSIYKVRHDRADITKQNLKEAERELDIAKKRYDEAKAAHKTASSAAKQAKKSYKLEQKSIKAREKAEKQAAKSNQ